MSGENRRWETHFFRPSNLLSRQFPSGRNWENLEYMELEAGKPKDFRFESFTSSSQIDFGLWQSHI